MKGMKRKFFLKRMWNFVVVMLIPALLLVAVTTYMTFVTQMHRMTQDNERGIEAVRSNISLVLDSVLAQNSYMTGMTRTNMVLHSSEKGKPFLHRCHLPAQPGILTEQHDQRV